MGKRERRLDMGKKLKHKRIVTGTFIRTKIRKALEDEADNQEITLTRLASELLERAVEDHILPKEERDGKNC